MAEKVTRLGRQSNRKKADRLTQAEGRAPLAERQEQWTRQRTALAELFIQLPLSAEVAEPLGRPAHRWGGPDGDHQAPRRVRSQLAG